MSKVVIVAMPNLDYGDKYAIVEVDAEKPTHYCAVLGKSVRVIESCRGLSDARERISLWE